MSNEQDYSEWFTIVDGKPVYSDELSGSNKAIAVEKYYEYLRGEQGQAGGDVATQ